MVFSKRHLCRGAAAQWPSILRDNWVKSRLISREAYVPGALGIQVEGAGACKACDLRDLGNGQHYIAEIWKT